MPVLLVNEDGTGEARFVSDRYSLADVVGRALIVHAGPDNYANIPTRYAATGPDATTLATGDAGGRAACGVIRRVARDD
jgi:Cu-Zn family superoxide dismutase